MGYVEDNMTYLSDNCVFDKNVYESTVPEDRNNGILRTITGPVAEWDKLNRNKRKYSERLWDNVLASSYVNEQLKYKTLFGEANHPTDRFETDFGRVSHSITKMWKVPASNQIYAEINILDTPLGRVLDTLYRSGSIIGYSSRAGGELHQKRDYVEVDENNYNFITFDAVPYPSVESARPGQIIEGTQLVSLTEETHNELYQLIKESSLENIKIVKDFIYSLEGYDFSKEKELISNIEESHNNLSIIKDEKDSQSKNENTIQVLKESTSQIESLKAQNQVLSATKESLLRENKNLKMSLNASLSRVSEMTSQIKDKESITSVSESKLNDTISKLETKVHDLEEDLETKEDEISSLKKVHEACKALEYKNKELEARKSDDRDVGKKLNEAILERDSLQKELKESYSELLKYVDESDKANKKIAELDEQVSKLKKRNSSISESYHKLNNEKDRILNESGIMNTNYNTLEKENTRLKEQIEDLRDSIKELNESVGNMTDSAEAYKQELVSVICGNYNLDVDAVRSKLGDNFTKSDVYDVCESMSSNLNGIRTIVGESSTNVNNVNDKSSRVRDLFSYNNNRRGNF